MSTVPPLAIFPNRRSAGRFAAIGRVLVVTFVGGAAAGGVSACVTGEDEPNLHVVATDPPEGAAHPATAALEVRFDAYLATVPLSSAAVRLTSGEVEIPVGLLGDPVARALVVRPLDELVPGLAYTLTVEPEGVRALDGRRLGAVFTLDFVATATGVRPPIEPPDFDADVRPLLERRCGCHGPPPAEWPPLEPAELAFTPSRADPHRVLLDPGAPMRSALILKILPGYPGVSGEGMPPGDALPESERRLLFDWVRSL